ncbi:MAG: hypothetical protein EXR50_00265 [Dehalococcoidia bacterium]|nr:hypothetical protein [Dehalococcoidia bacterium]
MALRTLSAILKAGLASPAKWFGIAGVLLVLAVLNLPPLAAFASSWYIPAAISLVSWLGMAATQVEPMVYRRILLYSAVSNEPYFIGALERRDALERQIQHLSIEGVKSDVKVMINSIDKEVLPGLAARIQRHKILAQGLVDLDQGKGPLVNASPQNVEALRKLEEEQKNALDGLITRLSDMNANLIGLSQEVEEGQVVEETETWAKELGEYWKATAEVFRPNSLGQM